MAARTRRIACPFERDLGPRRPNPDAVHKRGSQAAEDAQARQRHVTTKRVRDEINRMTQLEQCPDAMVFAERRSPGLEKRLRSDHQDFHRAVLEIVGKATAKVNVTLAVCVV